MAKRKQSGFLRATHIINKPVRTKYPEACPDCKGDCKDSYETSLGDTAMIVCSKNMEVLRHAKLAKESSSKKVTINSIGSAEKSIDLKKQGITIKKKE